MLCWVLFVLIATVFLLTLLVVHFRKKRKVKQAHSGEVFLSAWNLYRKQSTEWIANSNARTNPCENREFVLIRPSAYLTHLYPLFDQQSPYFWGIGDVELDFLVKHKLIYRIGSYILMPSIQWLAQASDTEKVVSIDGLFPCDVNLFEMAQRSGYRFGLWKVNNMNVDHIPVLPIENSWVTQEQNSDILDWVADESKLIQHKRTTKFLATYLDLDCHETMELKFAADLAVRWLNRETGLNQDVHAFFHIPATFAPKSTLHLHIVTGKQLALEIHNVHYRVYLDQVVSRVSTNLLCSELPALQSIPPPFIVDVTRWEKEGLPFQQVKQISDLHRISVIVVCGMTCSGKSAFSSYVCNKLANVTHLVQDDYYFPPTELPQLSDEEYSHLPVQWKRKTREDRAVPTAVNWRKLISDVESALADPSTQFILLEGNLIPSAPCELLQHIDYAIYLDTVGNLRREFIKSRRMSRKRNAETLSQVEMNVSSDDYEPFFSDLWQKHERFGSRAVVMSRMNLIPTLWFDCAMSAEEVFLKASPIFQTAEHIVQTAIFGAKQRLTKIEHPSEVRQHPARRNKQKQEKSCFDCNCDNETPLEIGVYDGLTSLLDNNRVSLILIDTISTAMAKGARNPRALDVLSYWAKLLSPHKERTIHKIDMAGLHPGYSDSNNINIAIKRATAAVRLLAKPNQYLIVGLSVKWDGLPAACAIMKRLTDTLPQPPLFLLGGIVPTMAWKDLPSRQKNDLLVVLGEGEATLDHILTIAESSETFSEFVNTERYARKVPNVIVPGLSRTHKPRRVPHDVSKYRHIPQLADVEFVPRARVLGYHQIELTRGCVWGKCTFCSIEAKIPNASSIRHYPLQEVLAEIEYIYYRTGVTSFRIHDWEIVGGENSDNPIQLQELVSEFGKLQQKRLENNLPLFTFRNVNIRANSVVKHINYISKLNQSLGFVSWFVGIESFSDAQLLRFQKGCTAEDNIRAIQLLKQHNIEFDIGMIFWGDAGTTIDEIATNLHYLQELELWKLGSTLFRRLELYRGTPAHYSHKRLYPELLGDIEDLEDVGKARVSYMFKDPLIQEFYDVFNCWNENAFLYRLVAVRDKSGRAKFMRLTLQWLTRLYEELYCNRDQWASSDDHKKSNLIRQITLSFIPARNAILAEHGSPDEDKFDLNVNETLSRIFPLANNHVPVVKQRANNKFFHPDPWAKCLVGMGISQPALDKLWKFSPRLEISCQKLVSSYRMIRQFSSVLITQPRALLRSCYSGGGWPVSMHKINCKYDEPLSNQIGHTFRPGPNRSVLDFGCGMGLYLGHLNQLGYDVVHGIEPDESLQQEWKGGPGSKLITVNIFSQQDEPALLNANYDVVICVEVIEHLPEAFHSHLFNFLARKTSRYLIFSGATPYQFGLGHISCKPEHYWREQLEQRKFIIDEDLTTRLRSSASFPWFQRNLLVSSKKKQQTRKNDILFSQDISC